MKFVADLVDTRPVKVRDHDSESAGERSVVDSAAGWSQTNSQGSAVDALGRTRIRSPASFPGSAQLLGAEGLGRDRKRRESNEASNKNDAGNTRGCGAEHGELLPGGKESA